MSLPADWQAGDPALAPPPMTADDAESGRALFRAAGAELVEGTDLFVDEKDRGREMEVPRAPPAGQPVRFGNLPTMFTQLDARRIGSGADCIGV